MSGGKNLMASNVRNIQKFEGNILINNDFLIVRLPQPRHFLKGNPRLCRGTHKV